MNRILRRVRRLVRQLGWDIVRYRPLWPALGGVELLPIRTILDIGAYDGDTARIFGRFFPNAHIYCFEPQPEPVARLAAWAATQQGRVHVLPFAVGNHDGMAELHRNPNAPRVASLTQPLPHQPNSQPDAHTLSTPIIRLDAAVSAHVPLVDGVLVKIDVEGSERSVLEGGAETLQRCVACIVEFHAAPRFAGQMYLTEGLPALERFGLSYGGILQQQFHHGRLLYFDAIFINRERADAIRPR